MKCRITKKECEVLFHQYNTPENVIRHCRAVAEVAVKIGSELNKHGFNFDTELIYGAALAHDVARTQENHGYVGSKILDEIGFRDESQIVKVHMFHDFNEFTSLTETDIVCLGDRLVKEDKYVGLDERIGYIINKPGVDEDRREIILKKKEETRDLIEKIQFKIGKTLDELFCDEEGNI